MVPSPTVPNFNIDSPKVTKITPCENSYSEYAGNVCGFTLYINGAAENRIGCETYPNEPFDDIIFNTNEVVLSVSVCFDWIMQNQYKIMNSWVMHTNMRTIGPMGGLGCVYYDKFYGHTLTGFKVHAGWAINFIGVNFERCRP